MFGVTILGNNSAVPAHNRHPTSQLVTVNDAFILIDCGEGTQLQMNKYKIRRSRITHILISHLHGDHYFGLPGLLTSMALLGRKETLHVFAPEPLKAIIDSILLASESELPFPLIFHPLQEEGIIALQEKFVISCFKVFHRIECYGFIISENKKPRKIVPEKAKYFKVPYEKFESLKEGFDYVTESGEIIKNGMITAATPPVKKYAYCADTMFSESLATIVKHVNLLYHEATYLNDQQEKAVRHYHSTSLQAAQIAKIANAKKLLIGHFSSKYEKLNMFAEEAKSVFNNTQLALEGATYLV